LLEVKVVLEPVAATPSPVQKRKTPEDAESTPEDAESTPKGTELEATEEQPAQKKPNQKDTPTVTKDPPTQRTTRAKSSCQYPLRSRRLQLAELHPLLRKRMLRSPRLNVQHVQTQAANPLLTRRLQLALHPLVRKRRLPTSPAAVYVQELKMTNNPMASAVCATAACVIMMSWTSCALSWYLKAARRC
jgi:hypothetical protein